MILSANKQTNKGKRRRQTNTQTTNQQTKEREGDLNTREKGVENLENQEN